MVTSLILWGIPIVAFGGALVVTSRRAAVRLCLALMVLTLLTAASWLPMPRAVGGKVEEQYTRLSDEQASAPCPTDCVERCEAAMQETWMAARRGLQGAFGFHWYFVSFSAALTVIVLRSPGRQPLGAQP